MRSELRREFLRRNKVASGRYQCVVCKAILKREQVQVDHIDPVIVPSVGFVDFNTLYSRTFCDPINLRILCKDCHRVKTNEENAQRKLHGTGVWSKEARKRNSEVNKGRKFSLSHRQAMSRVRKGKPQTPARTAACLRSKEKRAVPVIATNEATGISQVFPSAVDAGKALGIEPANICRICNKKQGRKQAGGYRFSYADTMVQEV